MDAIECLITRRSVRDFSEKEVEDKEIMEILKCAMFAPSAGDQRPWHFIVIRNKETMSKITQFHPHAEMLKTAKVAIAVIADTTTEKHQGYWVQDCSACVQNILLSAHALSAASVWLGIYPREERMKGLSALLNLPEYAIPFAVVAIGYPAKKIEQPERFDNTRIHFEKW